MDTDSHTCMWVCKATRGTSHSPAHHCSTTAPLCWSPALHGELRDRPPPPPPPPPQSPHLSQDCSQSWRSGSVAGRVARAQLALWMGICMPSGLGRGSWDLLDCEAWWKLLGGDTGTGCLAALGLQPWARASPPCSWSVQPQLGPPSWGSLSHTAHAWPSRGDPALLPTFLFNHAAGGPHTGVVRSNHSDTPLPSWPQPFAAVSYFSPLLPLNISAFVSVTVNLCLPPSFSGNVPASLSLRSLSGTKSGDTLLLWLTVTSLYGNV